MAPGPLGMLVLHNLLFWSGIGLLVHRTVRRPIEAFLAILTVGLLPPVLALLSTVWKDVGLGVSLVLAFALLLVADERRSLLGVVLALPLLFYATAVRYNGAAAVLPLALWAGSTAAARLLPMPAYRRSIGLAVGWANAARKSTRCDRARTRRGPDGSRNAFAAAFGVARRERLETQSL